MPTCNYWIQNYTFFYIKLFLLWEDIWFKWVTSQIHYMIHYSYYYSHFPFIEKRIVPSHLDLFAHIKGGCAPKVYVILFLGFIYDSILVKNIFLISWKTTVFLTIWAWRVSDYMEPPGGGGLVGGCTNWHPPRYSGA